MKHLATTVLLASLLTTGCGGSGGSSNSSTLIYGRGEDAKTLDPINTDVGESIKVMVNLYDTLVTYHDETTELVPSLATEWSHSDDGLTWTFQLREGVKFHDGTSFDSEAVAFSLERLIKDEHPHVYDKARPYAPSFSMLEGVTATKPLEVQFTLRRPSAVFVESLAMFPACVVSPSAVKKYKEKFGEHPVGTGPFRFEKWRRAEQLVLAANDDYWLGRPEVDHVIFVPVAKRQTRVERLKRGEIHIADNLAPDEVDALIKVPGIVAQTQPGMNVGYLTMQTEKEPLGNVKVRQAIWFALDKQELLDVAYAGHGKPAVNMVPPTIFAHHDELEDRPFDPKKARELLKQAAEEDGFNLPLDLTLSVMSHERPYMQKPIQVASFIKDKLKVVDINIDIKPRPANQHFDHLHRGEFQLGLAGWTQDIPDPDNFLYTLLDLDNISEFGNNLGRYRSEELHERLIAGQQELDREKRKQIYYDAQEILFRDAPVVPLVHTDVRIVQTKRLKGYKLHPAAIVRLRLSYFED